MLTNPTWLTTTAVCLLSAPLVFTPLALAQQVERQLNTEKGSTSDALAPHPLAWWTENPLRDDTAGDLMVGFVAPDGKPITLGDYQLEKKITNLGTIAGYKIVQVRTTIRPGPRVIAAGFAVESEDPAEWKDLLVGPEKGDSFVEIFALHFDVGGLVRAGDAAIYGSGADAVLSTNDRSTGNGGGCWEGYWWFDSLGAHEVDFSPLISAISHAIPAKSQFQSGCWALDMKHLEMNTEAQHINPECNACGYFGHINASFRIDHGIAKPVSIHFEPEQP